MGWNIWGNIQDMAKKVVSTVSNVFHNPVIASIASFVPGGSAIVNGVSNIAKSMEDKRPEEVLIQKKAIAIINPLAVAGSDAGIWKINYNENTRGIM
ncbi:MAG: hypothetical protein JJE17_07380 [Peptostreptococcaceae bacterium]|nr:hypothetical protein [Peptostreptococcaceae bacterium]